MHLDQQDEDGGRPSPGGCPVTYTAKRVDTCKP